MAKVPVDECPAGPELDAAVAKVLGLKVQWRQWADELQPVYLAGTYANEYDGWAEHEDWRRVLPYSADIAAAWEIISKIPVAGFVKLTIWEYGYVECTMSKLAAVASEGFDKFDGNADTASLAICRAFLKANGVVYVEMSE